MYHGSDKYNLRDASKQIRDSLSLLYIIGKCRNFHIILPTPRYEMRDLLLPRILYTKKAYGELVGFLPLTF